MLHVGHPNSLKSPMERALTVVYWGSTSYSIVVSIPAVCFHCSVKTMAKSNLGRKWILVSDPQDSKHDLGKSGQESGSRNLRKHWGMPLTYSLLVACSDYFLTYPGSPSSRLTTSTVICKHPHKSLIKKMLDRLVYRPILRRHFLNWNSFFPNDSILYQVEKTIPTNTQTCCISYVVIVKGYVWMLY